MGGPTPGRTEQENDMAGTITRTELEARIAAGGVTVLEALPRAYYEKEHLPGALNMPHDRSAAVVVYCSNPACQNSSIAQRRLQALGYTDVLKYAEGKEDWLAAGLAVESSVAAA